MVGFLLPSAISLPMYTDVRSYDRLHLGNVIRLGARCSRNIQLLETSLETASTGHRKHWPPQINPRENESELLEKEHRRGFKLMLHSFRVFSNYQSAALPLCYLRSKLLRSSCTYLPGRLQKVQISNDSRFEMVVFQILTVRRNNTSLKSHCGKGGIIRVKCSKVCQSYPEKMLLVAGCHGGWRDVRSWGFTRRLWRHRRGEGRRFVVGLCYFLIGLFSDIHLKQFYFFIFRCNSGGSKSERIWILNRTDHSNTKQSNWLL